MRETKARLGKAVAVAMALAMAATMLTGLSGCKFSRTVTELVPDMDSETKIEGMPPVQRVREDAAEGDDGARQAGDSDTHSKKDEDMAAASAYDEDSRDNELDAAKTRYAENPETSTQATEGGSKNGDAGSGSAKGGKRAGATAKSGGKGVGDGAGTGKGSGGSDDADQKSTAEDEPKEDEPEDDGTSDKGDGGKDEDAEKPESDEKAVPQGKRIAAAGEMANIVQMLTGELRAEDLKTSTKANYLVATDQNFKKAVEKKGVYPDEGVDQAVVAWNETDGTEGGLDVSALKKAKVDLVVYETGTDSLKNSEGKSCKSKLEAAGIDALAVDELNQDSDIVEAVELVAEALAGSAGEDKKAIVKKAAAWEDYHDNVLDVVADYNGGWGLCKGSDFDGAEISSHDASKKEAVETTIFWSVADAWWYAWDESKIDGKDLGLELYNYTLYPAAHYLCAAGVWDTGSASAAIVMAGRVSNFGETREQALEYVKTCLLAFYSYVAPVGFPLDGEVDRSLTPNPTSLGLKTTGFAKSSSIVKFGEWDCLHATNSDYDKKYDDGYYPGSEHFPGFIVRTADDKKAVEASTKRSTGMWNYRGVKPSEIQKNITRDNKYDTPFLSGDPKVYLAPTGLLHSWLEGSTESFLLSAWARNEFYGDMSASRASTAVADYYAQFYRSKDAAPSL